MTVYVDDMLLSAQIGRSRPARWSHLMADTSDELAAFANQLGLNPAWLQHPGKPTEHYDVIATKRQEALKLGAVSIHYGRAGGLLTWWKRALSNGNLEEAATIRAKFEAEISETTTT